MPNYIKEKRGQADYCNICGRYSELTWDHVPPKSVVYGSDCLVNTAFGGLPRENNYMKRYQSGIKYRSICRRCNNEILGTFDKDYFDFVTAIDQSLRCRGPFDSIIVSARINRVCRAMVGHMLAARNSYEPDPIPERKMREYLQNEKERMDSIHLYTWFYPYSTIVIAREFVSKGSYQGTHPNSMSSHISAYPIAYLISDEVEDCWMDDLSRYTTEDIDDEVEIVLHYHTLFYKDSTRLKAFNWPCNIGYKEYGDAVFAMGGSALTNDSRVAVRKGK